MLRSDVQVGCCVENGLLGSSSGNRSMRARGECMSIGIKRIRPASHRFGPGAREQKEDSG